MVLNNVIYKSDKIFWHIWCDQFETKTINSIPSTNGFDCCEVLIVQHFSNVS